MADAPKPGSLAHSSARCTDAAAQLARYGAQANGAHIELTAALNALTSLLIDAGVLDELLFVQRKATLMADAYEQALEQAKDAAMLQIVARTLPEAR